MAVKKMTFSETIVVPTVRVGALERARAAAIELVGGYTEVHGFGGWRDADGQVSQQAIAQITVWSDDWEVSEQWVLAVRDDLFSVGETDVFMSTSAKHTDDNEGTVAGIFTQ